MCQCRPREDGLQHIDWIARYFFDCVYDTKDIVAFALGMFSLVLYGVAMLPQLWKNYKRKRVEGLSLVFLLIWVAGDISNMTGAILTNQVATVKLTGAYFVVSDLFTLLQYLYYSVWFKRNSPFDADQFVSLLDEDDFGGDDDEVAVAVDVNGDQSVDERESSFLDIASYAALGSRDSKAAKSSADIRDRFNGGTIDSEGDFFLHPSANIQPPLADGRPVSDSTTTSLVPYSDVVGDRSSSSNFGLNSSHVMFIALVSLVQLINAQPSNLHINDTPLYCDDPQEIPEYGRDIGIAMAWLSASLYFFSRVPQIITNIRLKSVEGLSLMLFICTISANLLYGLGILIRFPALDAKFYASTLPYLIGSVGTLVFDFTIVIQSCFYRKPSRRQIPLPGDSAGATDASHIFI